MLRRNRQLIAELKRLDKAGLPHEAMSILRFRLAQTPDDPLVLVEYSSYFYEKKHFRRALHYAYKAHKIAPHDPYILWHLAGTYDMLGDDKSAIPLYRTLLRSGVRGVTRFYDNKFKAWCESLVNDVRLRLARCLAYSGQRRSALVLIRRYQLTRASGVGSIYSKREAQETITEALEHLQ